MRRVGDTVLVEGMLEADGHTLRVLCSQVRVLVFSFGKRSMRETLSG